MTLYAASESSSPRVGLPHFETSVFFVPILVALAALGNARGSAVACLVSYFIALKAQFLIALE